MRVVLLNGPPRSGKDTIARRLVGFDVFASGVLVEAKFATPLKEAASCMFPSVRWGAVRERDRDDPDKPHPALQGQTPRRVLIDLSENFFKPTFGVDYFGRRAADHLRMLERHGIPLPGDPTDRGRVVGVVFSDSGFAIEAGPVVQAVGASNVLVVHLHRTGCTFAGDSRGYLPEGFAGGEGVKIVECHNETWDDLDKIALAVCDWLAR